MIIVDTNIISELMRPMPSVAVATWLDGQDTQSLYLTSITLAELRYGIGMLPEGQRKQRLATQFEAYIDRGFEGRVLDFTAAAAGYYAQIMVHRKNSGRPMSMADGQIAAIAREHHFAIATRNEKDFELCELELINPF